MHTSSRRHDGPPAGGAGYGEPPGPVGIRSHGDVAGRSADPIAQEPQATLSGITTATSNDPATEARSMVGASLRQMWDVPPMAPATRGDRSWRRPSPPDEPSASTLHAPGSERPAG